MDVHSRSPAPMPAGVPSVAADTKPSPDTPARCSDKGVLDLLIRHSSPTPQPEAWSFLPEVEDVRRLQISAAKLETELRAISSAQGTDHPEASTKTTQERLRFISGKSSDFIVERDGEQRPIGVYNENGSLFIREWPVISCLLARSNDAEGNSHLPLLVVESISDLQICRALGFAAVLSQGLQNLSAAHVATLKRYRLDDDCGFVYRLFIADANFTDLNFRTPPRAFQVFHHLALMQESYKYDPESRCSRWRPDAKTIEQLRVARQFSDELGLHEYVTLSLPKAEPDRSWQYHIKPTRLSYGKVRSQLQNLLFQSGEIPQVAAIKKTVDYWRALFRKNVLEGIYEMADRTKSPLGRSTLIRLAECEERWFEKQPLVLAAAKVVAGKHPGNWCELNEDELENQYRLETHLWKLTKHAMDFEE